MKRLSLTLVLIFAVFITNAQISKGLNSKMEIVKYELPELAITDSLFLSSMDAAIIPLIIIEDNCKPNDFYYRIYFLIENDSEYVIVEQSKYPGRKQKDTIGYFIYNGYTFIVSGNAGRTVFDVTSVKRKFSYKDYIQPSVLMLEDDIPSWSFRFQNRQLYPNDIIVD